MEDRRVARAGGSDELDLVQNRPAVEDPPQDLAALVHRAHGPEDVHGAVPQRLGGLAGIEEPWQAPNVGGRDGRGAGPAFRDRLEKARAVEPGHRGAGRKNTAAAGYRFEEFLFDPAQRGVRRAEEKRLFPGAGSAGRLGRQDAEAGEIDASGVPQALFVAPEERPDIPAFRGGREQAGVDPLSGEAFLAQAFQGPEKGAGHPGRGLQAAEIFEPAGGLQLTEQRV